MSTNDKARDTAPRMPACAPPKGFRKTPGLKVKLQALLLHGPVLDDQGNKVTDLELIAWDHCPPIMQREYSASLKDTIPAANDPNFIIPRAIPDHRKKTAEIDIPEIAKTKRLSDDQVLFRRRILAKSEPRAGCWPKATEKAVKRKIASRPFPTSKNKKQRLEARKRDLND